MFAAPSERKTITFFTSGRPRVSSSLCAASSAFAYAVRSAPFWQLTVETRLDEVTSAPLLEKSSESGTMVYAASVRL